MASVWPQYLKPEFNIFARASRVAPPVWDVIGDNSETIQNVLFGEKLWLCLPDNASNQKDDIFELSNIDVHWVYFHSSAKIKNGFVGQTISVES